MSYVYAVSVTAGLCMITCEELCSCVSHACECTELSGKDCAGGAMLCCMQAHAQHPVSQGGDQLWPGMGALAPRGALSLRPLPILPDFHPVHFPERSHAPTCLLNLGFSQDNAVISGQ